MRYIKYLVLLSALIVLSAAYSPAQVVNEGFRSFNGPDRWRESGFRTFGSERASRDDYRGYRGGDSHYGGDSYRDSGDRGGDSHRGDSDRGNGSNGRGRSYDNGSYRDGSHYGNGGGSHYGHGDSHYGNGGGSHYGSGGGSHYGNGGDSHYGNGGDSHYGHGGDSHYGHGGDSHYGHGGDSHYGHGGDSHYGHGGDSHYGQRRWTLTTARWWTLTMATAADRITVDRMEAAVRPARLTAAAVLTTAAVDPTAVAKQHQQQLIYFKQGLTRRLVLYFEARFLVSLSQALKHRGAHNRQANRGVDKHFAKPSTLVRRNKLAP